MARRLLVSPPDRAVLTGAFAGEWLARHIPGARVRLRDGEGHLSIAIGSYAEILDDLLTSAGSAMMRLFRQPRRLPRRPRREPEWR